jgi:hypothetical protein
MASADRTERPEGEAELLLWAKVLEPIAETARRLKAATRWREEVRRNIKRGHHLWEPFQPMLAHAADQVPVTLVNGIRACVRLTDRPACGITVAPMMPTASDSAWPSANSGSTERSAASRQLTAITISSR